MLKKTFFSLIAIFLLSSLLSFQTKATTDLKGKLVKMNGNSAVYYVAQDGNRYVFPNEKIYKTWFTNFDDVITVDLNELGEIPLAGNVLYRPGVVLIKTISSPNVYAVSKNGKIRSISSEANAQALYGENWNKLIDDVPDSFFTNYTIGEKITDENDFDPEDEMDETTTIEKNFGFSHSNGLTARTKKCSFINHVRHCGDDSNGNNNNNNDDNNENEEDYSNYPDDGEKPRIEKITITSSGKSGYIDTGDKIIIDFSEAIHPKSIHADLKIDNIVNSLEYNITGAVNIYSDGVFEIKNIASFDLGEVEDPGEFSVKFELKNNAKSLHLTLLSGNEIKIDDEDFEDAKQISNIIKDMHENFMENDNDIGKAKGNFGGENTNDGIPPYISSIKVYNVGSDDYIAVNDQIKITFSEPIDPRSIHNDLDEDEEVTQVDSNDTGGIDINDNGILTIIDIASFFIGNVEDDADFDVSLALNSAGDILTITLTKGNRIMLTDEDLDDAKQIGDTVEDKDGNEMENDPNISDPKGTFIGDSTGSDLYIDFIKAYDKGFAGYIDENDELVITFNEAISSESIDLNTTLAHDETGGVHIDENGIFTVTDILSFNVGNVAEKGEFETRVTLSSNKKVLTVKLLNGDEIKLNQEIFSNTKQIGGFIINDEDNSVVMKDKETIDAPEGTFGGDAIDNPPYITEISVTNGGYENYIDEGDKIVVTFSEAIDPDSIDNSLELDDYIENVDEDDTGGIVVSDNGELTITDIAKFTLGNVEDDAEFDVKLALNEIGNILTITLESGQKTEITFEDLDDAEQIGGTIEDEDSSKMEDDPRIDDPEGSF